MSDAQEEVLDAKLEDEHELAVEDVLVVVHEVVVDLLVEESGEEEDGAHQDDDEPEVDHEDLGHLVRYREEKDVLPLEDQVEGELLNVSRNKYPQKPNFLKIFEILKLKVSLKRQRMTRKMSRVSGRETVKKF